MFGKKKHIHMSGDGFDIDITSDGDIIGAIGESSVTINRYSQEEDTRPFQYVDSSGKVLYRCEVCPAYHRVGHPHFAEQ